MYVDVNADCGQAIDQQALVLILRKNQQVRKRAQTLAHFPEDGTRRLPAGHPEICRDYPPATFDDGVGEADLAVELERPSLHGKRARRRPRFRSLVDNPHAHAEPRQPQGQDQARRPCADDEDVCLARRRSSHCLRSLLKPAAAITA